MDHFIHDEKTLKDRQVLLFLDNHESHMTEAATQNVESGITMLIFPPYISYKIQPLKAVSVAHLVCFTMWRAVIECSATQGNLLLFKTLLT
jgi:hypothetical protein